ncbi:MAG TPA: FecR domain-containing protein [Chryseolinea sp.]|nr:FecR domain-containing protein [Chryseolinea sp.]
MDEQMMIRYFRGECSLEEEAILREWLQKSYENKKLFYEQKALWNYRHVKRFGTEEQIGRAMSTFNNKLNDAESRIQKRVFFRLAKYAAVFIFTSTLSVFLYISYQRQTRDGRLMTISVTQTDSSRLVTLVDGSRVWLNSNSSISYPKEFSHDERMVHLRGEGYFEVAHDSLHPFIVKTDAVQVKVLGTSFNILSSEKKTETTLVTGRVIIQNKKGDNLAVLTPGQMGAFDNASQYLSVNVVDVEQYIAWRQGTVSFTNTTLGNIAGKHSELYQVRFVFDSSKVDRTAYNFNFRKGQPLDEVLEMLSFIAPIKYVVQGEEVFITGFNQ